MLCTVFTLVCILLSELVQGGQINFASFWKFLQKVWHNDEIYFFICISLLGCGDIIYIQKVTFFCNHRLQAVTEPWTGVFHSRRPPITEMSFLFSVVGLTVAHEPGTGVFNSRWFLFTEWLLNFSNKRGLNIGPFIWSYIKSLIHGKAHNTMDYPVAEIKR